MNIKVYSYSDKGDRQNNEDAVSTVYWENELLAIMADGVGGYQAGEVASNYTILKIKQIMQEQSRNVDTLLSAVKTVNSEIRMQQRDIGNMMSTVAALWIQNNESVATAVNVGDTRIYQFRDGNIVYQSVDHSIAQMAVYAGEILPSEIRGYSGRNRLIRALGAENNIKTECITLDIFAGDSFLICTDGFWEIVTEEMMLQTLAVCSSPEKWLDDMKKIIEQEKMSKKDNHSAIVIMIS